MPFIPLRPPLRPAPGLLALALAAGALGVATTSEQLGPRDAVLVFTHDPKLDVPALMAAFTTNAGYIGALGSRKTTHDRESRLREAGATGADLARVFAPAGLDIGAATVEETAIAVLGEITAHRSGRPGAPLRETSGTIRREDAGSLTS